MARKEVDIICKICNREFKTIFSFTGHLRTHSMTSNPKQSKEYIELLREHNLEKFGYEWAIATSEVREKIDTTVQERYGVSNVFADEEVKQKLRKTKEEKYGGTMEYLMYLQVKR